MKDSLFEILMNFFEKSLSQLQKSNTSTNPDNQAEPESYDAANLERKTITIKSSSDTAIRVFTEDEKAKFTKASYQFLSQLLLWGIIAPETMELIITQLLFSDSRYVTLQETKWTIRNTLAENLNASQLAFLDLVLYQKEDKLPTH